MINILNNKGGKLQKFLVLILLTSLLVLILIGINSAENITEDEIVIDDDFDVIEETNDLLEEEIEILEDTEEIKEEIIENDTIEEEIIEEENETIGEEVLDNNLENKPATNLSQDNVTEILNNSDQTSPEPVNATSQDSNRLSGVIEEEIKEVELPELDIKISNVKRVTRNDSTEIVVILENIGIVEVKDISLNWDIPSGFEITSGNKKEKLGNLLPKESITSAISLQATTSTSLGINEIKLKINYAND